MLRSPIVKENPSEKPCGKGFRAVFQRCVETTFDHCLLRTSLIFLMEKHIDSLQFRHVKQKEHAVLSEL